MKRFKNILYVLNQAATEAPASLIRTVAMAKNNQANLTLLYVLPKLSLSSYSKAIGIDRKDIQKTILEHEEASLHQLIASLGKDTQVKVALRLGKKYVESIRAVQANNFDLIVKEAEDISWLKRFIGSDDMQLLRKCPCPVWLMKKNEKPNYEHIMAAVDFDADNEESCNDELNKTIIDLASSLSLSDFASLHVVNAYDVPEAGFITLWAQQPDKIEQELFESEHRNRRHKMEVFLNELKQKLGKESYDYLSPRSHIVRGLAGEELPKVAARINADLVVMGTVARTGISGVVIGNTAETVLSQLQCSILAIKPAGFVSPVS